MHNTKEINILEQQRTALLHSLMSITSMIVGSYKEVYRKCGKPNCWCQSSGSGHPFRRVTWNENGVSCTKAVSSEILQWVQEATENHKKFRSLMAALREIESQISAELQKYGAQVIEKTREKNRW